MHVSIPDSVPEIIKKTFPIPGRFKSALPANIRELSHLLTNNRGERNLSYLSEKKYLYAYLYYFLPWNLHRLCILLPKLDIQLNEGGIITDIGCGPLTFASALWITRPELRSIPLEINCIDRSSSILEAGKKFFTALCAKEDTAVQWKIRLIKKDIDFRKANTATEKQSNADSFNRIDKNAKKRDKAALVCAINIFNELYESIFHNNTNDLRRIAENAARFMHNEAEKNAFILTVEPGVPQSGKFISLLRDAFLELNRRPVSPCTHILACPLSPHKLKSGETKRWCHFAFDTFDAPGELQKLSAACRLPKDRLVFSYLLAGNVHMDSKLKTEETEIKNLNIEPVNINTRVISDMFPLPDGSYGRYGCSSHGLVLLKGSKTCIGKAVSCRIVNPELAANKQRDAKSGALISELKAE